MSIRVTVTGRGDPRAIFRQEMVKKLEDLKTAFQDKSPVDEGTFKGAFTLDPVALTIENNVEHAEAVARGRSPQAQDGWMEAEIDAWRR